MIPETEQIKSVTFKKWLEGLRDFTRQEPPTNSWADSERRDFYEGQPDSWESFFASGYTPEDAAREDQTYWEA